MLTTPELAQLRADTVSWFDATCDIYVVAVAEDVYGGVALNHPVDPTYTDIPCMVESGAAQEQERLTLAGLTEIQMFTVTLPALTQVSVGDHLKVHKGEEDLHLYVRAVMGPESYELERKVVCTEVGATAPH